MRVEDHRSSLADERVAGLVHVLQRLWTYSLTTKSDEVRTFADEIAEASSRGFITTSVIPKGEVYGRLWKLTPEGTQFLYDHAHVLASEEMKYEADHVRG